MQRDDPIRAAMTAAAPLNMRVRDAGGGLVAVECRACGWGGAWADVVPEKYAERPYGCGRCEGRNAA